MKTSRVYRSLWLQPRRIVCEHCYEAFVYLASGRVKSQVELWRGTAESVFATQGGLQLGNKVAKATKGRRLGRALCAHCRRYQGWMIRRSWSVVFAGAIAAGSFLGFLASCVFADPVESAAGWTTGGFVAGLFAALAWVSLKGPWPGAHLERRDPWSLSDPDWNALVAASGGKTAEAARRWFALTGERLKKNTTLWPLDLRDDVGVRSV
jgi:hypothetical protein